MIFELLKETLIHQLGIEETCIKPDAYIQRDLELDSTETVVIALELKKKHKIDYRFPGNDITLQEIVNEANQLLQA